MSGKREQIREFIHSSLRKIINEKMIGEIYSRTTHRIKVAISPDQSMYGRQSLVDLVQQLTSLISDAEVVVRESAVMQDPYDDAIWNFGVEGCFTGTYDGQVKKPVSLDFILMGCIARGRFIRLSLVFDSEVLKKQIGQEPVRFLASVEYGPRRDSLSLVPQDQSIHPNRFSVHSRDFGKLSVDEFAGRILSDIWASRSSAAYDATSGTRHVNAEKCIKEHALYRDLSSTFYNFCYERKNDTMHIFMCHDRTGFARNSKRFDIPVSEKGAAYFGLGYVQLSLDGKILRDDSLVNLKVCVRGDDTGDDTVDELVSADS